MTTPTRTRADAKRETRRALIAAGIEEFAERGLDAPSLDAICARAGYTRGAFYVHFRDRDDFVVAVMEELLGAFLDATIAADDSERGLEETVIRYVAALPAFGGAAPPGALLPPGAELQLHRLLEACARSPRIRNRLASLLGEAIARVAAAAADGQKAGTVREDVDAEPIGAILVALALGAVTALEVGVELDPARARDALLRLLRPA